MAAIIDLEVPRNGDYHETWHLADLDGTSLDISSGVIEMSIADIAGGTVLGAAIINPIEPQNGYFTVTIRGSDFDAYGWGMEVVRLSYDLKYTQGGISTIYARGNIILYPKVTQ